jgi:hypothetical protein
MKATFLNMASFMESIGRVSWATLEAAWLVVPAYALTL